MDGVLLYLEHPDIINRDCNDCMRFVYNENTGKQEIRHGKPVPRTGLPPCAFNRCPKKSPDFEILPRNVQAFNHYRECKAINDFPPDPIVKRNAGIIQEIQEYVKQKRETHFQLMQHVNRNH